VELCEQIRCEYEFGVGTSRVARKMGVLRRIVVKPSHSLRDPRAGAKKLPPQPANDNRQEEVEET